MRLGTEVGIGPDDIVLDGNPAPPPKKGAEPLSPIIGPVYCGETAPWIKMPLDTEVGLSIVLDGDAAPLP